MANGWAFKSKAPDLPRANHISSYIYLVPHDGSAKLFVINGPQSPINPNGMEGDSSSPEFSPDSRKLAYFQMKDVAYESDRRTLYENSLVWHQQVFGWLNQYSGVEKTNPDAVTLADTVIPVVDYNP